MQSFPLWPDAAPGALGTAAHDRPAVTVYPAGLSGGPAVVVFPGGGYWMHAGHEGDHYARFLAAHGITAFVVPYRLAQHGYRHPCMILDAARAVRTVRARAAEWDIDPARIGVMGSSAGGHLAAHILVAGGPGDPASGDPVERVSSRPDLGILCYPVVSSDLAIRHGGSYDNLLGPGHSAEQAAAISPDRLAGPGTAPAFIWHTVEDAAVNPLNAVRFAGALHAAGVRYELHLYEKGAHGIGLADAPPFRAPHRWSADLLAWLRERGWVA